MKKNVGTIAVVFTVIFGILLGLAKSEDKKYSYKM